MPHPALPVVAGIRPLWANDEMVVAYHRGRIAVTDIDLSAIRWQVDLPALSRRAALAAKTRLTRRILRVEPTDAIEGAPGSIFINNRSVIWRLDLDSRTLVPDFAIPDGRNALALCPLTGVPGFDDGLCFGDYFDNPGKGEVRIWRRSIAGDWDVAYRFGAGEIDHVHALVPDPHRQCLWILTGDIGSGAALWQARDNFTDVRPVLRGDQLYRATWLYPTPEALYYATDTQLEQNYLCRLTGSGDAWRVDRVRTLPGSSIYGAPIPDGFLFSTAIEPGMPSGRLIPDLIERRPGPGIQGNRAFVYRLGLYGRCTEILAAEKDIWPLRLMQFGTFHLCAAPGGRAYAYGVAVRAWDGKAAIIDTSIPA